MVNQGIWVGIAVGVFLAGLGIGIAVLQPSSQPSMTQMSPQQMQQMMQDPQMMNQWMNSMMNDPQAMQQMHDTMMNNPQHMNQMMGPMMDTMMNNPQMQQQMMTQMMSNQGMMSSMMNNQDMMNMMGGNMMMGNNMMMGPGMMQGSSSSGSQSLPTGEATQTRTFDIFLDEVKIFAESENENGEEEIVEVELHLWNPSNIIVNKGDTVVLKVSNPRGSIHSLAIPQFGVSTGNLEPRGGTETIEFVADQAGVFTFLCNTPYVPAQNWCSADHAAMTGTITVLE